MRAGLLSLACLFSSALFAQGEQPAVALGDQTAVDEIRYVGGRIQLGLHADSQFSSAVLALLPTGTELVLIEQVNGLARVRSVDGVEGWVDAAFLTGELPDNAEPAPLDDANFAQQAAEHAATLATLREDLDALRVERDTLAAQLERADSTSTPLRPVDEPAEQESIEVELPGSTLAELQGLAAENTRLKQALQRLISDDDNRAASAGVHALGTQPAPIVLDPQTAPAPWTVAREWGLWMYVLLGSLAVLSFAFGAALVQWDVRRRHGGFRI